MSVKRYSIVGTAFCEGGNQIIGALKRGDELTLVREPTNKFDLFAVAIYSGASRIGYVPRRQNAALAQYIDQAGEPAMAFDGKPKAIHGRFTQSENSGFPMVEVEGKE